MVDKRIRALQNKLNRMMVGEAEFDRIYELSVKLDKLILQHYNNQGYTSVKEE